jgi:hypothetical protein
MIEQMVDNTAMNMKKSTELSRPSIVQYIVCYIVWAIFSAMSIWLLLTVRINLLQPLIFAQIDPRTLRVIDNFSLIIIALIVVAAIFLIEHTLRKALEKGYFWTRVARVAIVEVGVLGASYLLQFVLRALVTAV